MNPIRAAVFDPDRGLEIRDIPRPDVEGGEMLVDVLGCTLCGSDLHTITGRRPANEPTILGHEIVGRVVLVADDTTDLQGQSISRGDRVTWAIVAHCGNCFYCQRDLPQKCLHATKFGHESLSTGRELYGGLADCCLLPSTTSVIQVPDELSLSTVCPASCATATIAATLDAAGPLRDRNVVVYGAGMLGLTAAAMLRHGGAAEIVCVDPSPQRRELSLAFGATEAVPPEDVETFARGKSSWHGFDIALELSGQPAAFDSACRELRIGGTLLLVGAVFPTDAVSVAMEQIVRRHLTIHGIHNYAPRHLLQAVEFLAACHRQFPFERLVQQWFSLDQLDEALAASHTPGAIRIGVQPQP